MYLLKLYMLRALEGRQERQHGEPPSRKLTEAERLFQRGMAASTTSQKAWFYSQGSNHNGHASRVPSASNAGGGAEGGCQPGAGRTATPSHSEPTKLYAHSANESSPTTR